jgi:sec-independent protein translocase protein TatA
MVLPQGQFAELLGLGTPELLIILVIILLLFGSTKLPQLSKSIGSSIKELRNGINDDGKDDKKSSDADKKA